MRVWVCGVRGSTPAPGADFTRYGGHTSCLALARDGRPPSLILDAGTGIRRVSTLLEGAPFRGTILLGHLHWDHTQGLPFFSAGDRPDAEVDLLLPAQGDAMGVLERFMSPPHFPIAPAGLRGTWSIDGLEPGDHHIGDFEVLVREIPHKGGRTFGFRVADGTGSLAYLSDHSPVSLGPGPAGLGPYHEAALALADGVDLLVHDAQHRAAELAAVAGFGHSAAEYAVGLAEAAGARRVLLFHHDPTRTDVEIDALVAGLAPGPVEVSAAAEGMILDLGGGAKY
jgi:phosphoribosyl 1,2-cyclic phosphodiesterase